ncbi:MAG: hypothetical protein BRC31_05190 [Actinobacteria bacterium QS_5_72_10]|nr:MAG: hypothetical protein BRC31_05190 [Actinobacteria bacterium QS_5_72_10]
MILRWTVGGERRGALGVAFVATVFASRYDARWERQRIASVSNQVVFENGRYNGGTLHDWLP